MWGYTRLKLFKVFCNSNLASAEVLTCLKRTLLLCLSLFFSGAAAQDTVSLGSVDISISKTDQSLIGKKQEKVDSLMKRQFVFQSLAELLSATTPIFIKSYGPGSIASTSFRGGNASQTAFLWNGFNIQNSMLGQADLALLPVCLFDDISIEYGGSSALWGNGAVGGSVRMENRSAFNKGVLVSGSVGGGSFGRQNSSLVATFSGSRLVSSTRWYFVKSHNDYAYRDSIDKEQPVKNLKNAAYTYSGLLQELRWAINSKQIFSVNVWANQSHRRIPSFNLTADSKTYQDDATLRTTANWSYQHKRLNTGIKAALFVDRINYTDSLAAIFSKNDVSTLIIENENFYTWFKNHQVNFGLNYTSSSANTNNYEGPKNLDKFAFVAGNKSTFFEQKLIAHAGMRLEHFSAGTLPLTYNVSLTYRFFRSVFLMANIAKVYRQPTLNELYWQPGGNSGLKPEQGNTYEMELKADQNIKAFKIFVSLAAYSRYIDNWILWLPGAGGNASPLNIQKVWSRGTETTLRLNYSKKRWNLSAGSVFGYVLSTTIESDLENSNSVDKQLIYTPRYTVNGNAAVGYGNVQLVYFHQYIGFRFTSTDNLQWLEPYHVSNLRVNISMTTKKINLVIFGACNNLFDISYEVMQGRPMPLKNYEIGTTIQFKNYKNKQKP